VWSGVSEYVCPSCVGIAHTVSYAGVRVGMWYRRRRGRHMCRTEFVGRVQDHVTTITLRIIVPGSFALAARVLGGADSNRGSDVRWGHTTHCSWVPDDGLHRGCIHRSSPWRLSRRIGQLFHWRQGDFSFLFPTRRGARTFFPFSSTAANFVSLFCRAAHTPRR
jgi:hypothetical protein